MKINLSGDLSNHAAEFCLAARESHLFPRSEMVETIFDRLSMTTSGLSSEINSNDWSSNAPNGKFGALQAFFTSQRGM